MGKLADDMLRLSQEIQGLRDQRLAYVRSLRTEVESLRKEFRDAQERSARETRALLQEVTDDLQQARLAWSGLASSSRHAATVPALASEAPPQPEAGRRKRKGSGGSQE